MTYGSSWATRLSALAHLNADDNDALSAMTHGARHRRVDQSFIESDDAANLVVVMIEGLACKSRFMADGRRQILSHLLPGDMTSPDQLLAPTGRGISMLVPSEIALLDRADIDKLRRRPNISDAFGRYSLMKEAITAEWQLNVGCRTAQERVAHLLCETYARLESIGHAAKHTFRLTLTQCQIADSVALSAVHVNRVLMELRRQRVIAMGNGMVVILDDARLRAIAGFDSGYLGVDIGEAPRDAARDVRRHSNGSEEMLAS